MKKILYTLLFALVLSAKIVNAQGYVITDYFTTGGFNYNGLGTSDSVGTMTLSFDNPIAPNSTNYLSAFQNYNISVSILGSDGQTYNFDNTSLANGSNTNGVQIITLNNNSGFLFFNDGTAGNTHGGSADFLNSNGSFLTTAPPGFLSANGPNAINNGYSLYFLGNGVNGPTSVPLARGDYGALDYTVNQVPEPSTVALFGIGLSALYILRRKNTNFYKS